MDQSMDEAGKKGKIPPQFLKKDGKDGDGKDGKKDGDGKMDGKKDGKSKKGRK